MNRGFRSAFFTLTGIPPRLARLVIGLAAFLLLSLGLSCVQAAPLPSTGPTAFPSPLAVPGGIAEVTLKLHPRTRSHRTLPGSPGQGIGPRRALASLNDVRVDPALFLPARPFAELTPHKPR